MADLAAGQIADDLAALRAALGFASNFEFGSWTMDHSGKSRTLSGLLSKEYTT